MAVLWGSAILSAVVDNIPYVAVMNPLIVAIARKSGYRITFWQFFKFGFPVMIGSVAFSAICLSILFLR